MDGLMMVSEIGTIDPRVFASGLWSRRGEDGVDRRAVASLDELGRKVAPDDRRQIRRAALQLASTLFFQPLLQEMRKLSADAKFAHGGRGEDVFGQQLDLRIADTVAASDAGGMTGWIAKQLERSQARRTAAAVENAIDVPHAADQKDAVRQPAWTTAIQSSGNS
jgi:Rod binding domain-containing protein